MYDFVAIDFENANNEQFICQIGIITVKQGIIEDEICMYIKPPGNKYGKIQTSIHGIDSNTTIDSPELDEVWDEIKPFFENKTLLMHNASADISILTKSLFHYFIPVPEFKVIDTCVEIGKYKLSVLASAYKVELNNHHDALQDARAVAQIWLKHLDGFVTDQNDFTSQVSDQNNFKSKKIDSNLLTPDLSLCKDVDNPVYDRKVVLTGDFYNERKSIALKLKNLGADIDTSISKRTNYVVVGNNPGPSKMEQVDNLIKNGFEIVVINEQELNSIFDGTYSGRIPPKNPIKLLKINMSHIFGKNNKFQVDNEIINLFANKEFFVDMNVSGDRRYLLQLIGYLGASHNGDIEKTVDIILISDRSIINLKEGVSDNTIDLIENAYNSSRAKIFNFQFVTESEFLEYYKVRVNNKFKNDSAVVNLYNLYMNSVFSDNLDEILK